MHPFLNYHTLRSQIFPPFPGLHTLHFNYQDLKKNVFFLNLTLSSALPTPHHIQEILDSSTPQTLDRSEATSYPRMWPTSQLFQVPQEFDVHKSQEAVLRTRYPHPFNLPCLTPHLLMIRERQECYNYNYAGLPCRLSTLCL